MLKYRRMNLLDSKCDIIAHQTNCVGVMGAGVAKQIKDKHLSEKSFNEYVRLCKDHGEKLLGHVQFLFDKNGNRLVANLFGENIPTGTGVDTDYDALKEAFEYLEAFASTSGMSVAIPGYIGCGLAGGDWEQVYEIIYMTFKDSKVDLEICFLPEATNLPEGYEWKHYEDGSGCIEGPNKEWFYSYDRAPYHYAGGMEYQKDKNSDYSIFWDGFSEFKKFAEAEIREKLRENVTAHIINEYHKDSVEFSSAFLDIPAGDMSLLDAVELYAKLQYLFNGDYVFFVKEANINGKEISGYIDYFDVALSVKDKGPAGATITELLHLAKEKAEEITDGNLVRLISSEIDGMPEPGGYIKKGELVDFIF